MKPRAPVISAVAPNSLVKVYSNTNYSFLFAPVFHTGMRYVAPIRKQLPWRTIFNNIGPLANPVEDVLECRVIGVARKDLGPAFAEALKIAGCRKAMIICGEEELDERLLGLRQRVVVADVDDVRRARRLDELGLGGERAVALDVALVLLLVDRDVRRDLLDALVHLALEAAPQAHLDREELAARRAQRAAPAG